MPGAAAGPLPDAAGLKEVTKGLLPGRGEEIALLGRECLGPGLAAAAKPAEEAGGDRLARTILVGAAIAIPGYIVAAVAIAATLLRASSWPEPGASAWGVAT